MAITQIRIEEILNFKANVIASPLTGYTSGSGTVSATDSVLQAVQKLNGNAALLAPLASPTLTGTPTAPTATLGTNTTQIATTAFVLANASGGGAVSSLTTSGSSGVATLVSGVLNVPNYSLPGLGGVPTSTTVAGFALTGNITLGSHTASTGLTGTSYNGSAAQSWTVDQTFTPTWTGVHKFQDNSVGTTVTPQVYVSNETAATSGTAQLLSPTLSLRAHYWTGSVDHTSDIMMYNQANSYGSYLTFAFSDGGGAATNLFQVSQYGDFIGFGNNSSGSITIEKSGMTATYNDGMRGFILQGLSAATSGVPARWSPSLNYQAKVWNTSGTPASNYLEFNTEVRPVSSAAPTGALYFSARLSAAGTGTFIDLANLSNIGNLTLTGALMSPNYKTTVVAHNTSTTLAVTDIDGGTISCTATAAVTYTMPTATLLGTQFVAVQGTYADFWIDNSASTSAGVVTVTLGTGETAMTAITGENTLTVAIGIVACFRIYFVSATVAKIGRLM